MIPLPGAASERFAGRIHKGERMTWWTYALLSATAAAATAVLAKIGVQGVSSNLATAIRTLVVLLFSCGIVLATVEHP